MNTIAPPGRTAADRLAAVRAGLRERAVVGDLYDGAGALMYDDIARRDTHEVREIVAAVRRVPGAVLDLAAGAGRLTLPLLAVGRRVTALELSPAMLQLLRQRLAASAGSVRARCTPVRGDMRSFRLPDRFGAIVLGTTSISLLERAGRAALFAAVRAHLAPGGRFLVSTVALAPDAPAELSADVPGASGATYRMHEIVEAATGSRTVIIHPLGVVGDAQIPVALSIVQVLAPDLLGDELRAAGLVPVATRPIGGDAGRYRAVLIEAAAADGPPSEIPAATAATAAAAPLGSIR